jgi:hypothetical protein
MMKNKQKIIIALVALIFVGLLGHFVPLASKNIDGCTGSGAVDTRYMIIIGENVDYNSGQLKSVYQGPEGPESVFCGTFKAKLYLW